MIREPDLKKTLCQADILLKKLKKIQISLENKIEQYNTTRLRLNTAMRIGENNQEIIEKIHKTLPLLKAAYCDAVENLNSMLTETEKAKAKLKAEKKQNETVLHFIHHLNQNIKILCEKILAHLNKLKIIDKNSQSIQNKIFSIYKKLYFVLDELGEYKSGLKYMDKISGNSETKDLAPGFWYNKGLILHKYISQKLSTEKKETRDNEEICGLFQEAINIFDTLKKPPGKNSLKNYYIDIEAIKKLINTRLEYADFLSEIGKTQKALENIGQAETELSLYTKLTTPNKESKKMQKTATEIKKLIKKQNSTEIEIEMQPIVNIAEHDKKESKIITKNSF